MSAASLPRKPRRWPRRRHRGPSGADAGAFLGQPRRDGPSRVPAVHPRMAACAVLLYSRTRRQRYLLFVRPAPSASAFGPSSPTSPRGRAHADVCADDAAGGAVLATLSRCARTQRSPPASCCRCSPVLFYVAGHPVAVVTDTLRRYQRQQSNVFERIVPEVGSVYASEPRQPRVLPISGPRAIWIAGQFLLPVAGLPLAAGMKIVQQARHARAASCSPAQADCQPPASCAASRLCELRDRSGVALPA